MNANKRTDRRTNKRTEKQKPTVPVYMTRVQIEIVQACIARVSGHSSQLATLFEEAHTMIEEVEWAERFYLELGQQDYERARAKRIIQHGLQSEQSQQSQPNKEGR